MPAAYQTLFTRLDPPFASEAQAESAWAAPAFAAELRTASRLWVRTGYAQGIAAYLNFFLLKEFIETHDRAYPPRFTTLRSMANSFYRTDVFIRDVTDSGVRPTGGISNPAVRGALHQIMERHARLSIPVWMMVYFGFQLAEAVEQECAPLAIEDKARHLSYMAKAYRIMGIPFSHDRPLMERFARSIEVEHAGASPQLERHARNILLIGEMVGVSSDRTTIIGMLPEPTRALYAPLHDRVRPGFAARLGCRLAGRVLLKRAVGPPREAVPWTLATKETK